MLNEVGMLLYKINLLIWQKSVEITLDVLYFRIALGAYLFHCTALPMDCGSMTWRIRLLSDTQRTLASELFLRDSETTVNWATFIVKLCVLNTIPKEKQWMFWSLITLRRTLGKNILCKDVHCKMNVNTHNRLTVEVISHSHSAAIRATMLIFA